MLDEVAIQQVLNRYTEGASRRDWDQVMSTFLPDGVWEIAGLNAQFQGHEALRAAMVGFVAAMDYFVQVNAPAVIAVDGDRATARSIIRECGKYAGRDEGLEVMGQYADELLRTDEGWKFVRRRFTGLAQHILPMRPANLFAE